MGLRTFSRSIVRCWSDVNAVELKFAHRCDGLRCIEEGRICLSKTILSKTLISL